MSEHILSSEELEELIKIGFRFKYNIEPSFVDIAIETTTTGYGLNEKEEPCVTVSVQFSNLQQLYNHEPVSHAPVIIHKSVATPERPSYTSHYCSKVGDILSTLQRLIADNPKLAEDSWFVDGDDGTINFQNHFDYIS